MHFPDQSIDAPAPGRRFPLVALQSAGVALALAAQLMITVAPWFSLFAFGAGALLFLIAERLRPAPPEPTAVSPEPGGLRFWLPFLGGTAICIGAGFAVHAGADRILNHTIWFIGLMLLAGAALLSWRRGERASFDRRTAAAFAVVALVAGMLFFWDLTTMPPEVHGDDAEVGNDAVLLLDRELNLFTTGWFELPMFHAFPTAVGLKIAGVNLYGLRGTSAVLGFLSVLLLFGVARRLWGLEVAFLSGLLLALSRFFIHLSRAGYHYIDTPFLSILAVFLFLRLWYDLRFGAAIWCGILFGLGLQTYYAGRLAPVLLGLTFLLWLAGSGWSNLRPRIVRFAVLVVASIATAAPMIGYFSNHWDAFMARTRGTSVFSPESIRHLSYGYKTSDFTEILLIQLKQALTLFNLTGDTSVQYSYRAGGLLEPVSAAFFVLGLGVLLARPLAKRNQIAFLWIALPTIAGAALTIDTPFYPRISGIMPFVALTVAVALHSFLQSIREGLPARTGRIAAAAVAGILVLFIFSNNVWTYFVEYAPKHRHSPAVDISSFVREHGGGKVAYMVGGAPGFFIKHGAIRFLTYGYDTRDIVDLEEHAARQPLDPAKSIFIVMPNGSGLIPRLEELVGPAEIRPYYNIFNDLEFTGVVPYAGRGAEPGAEAASALQISEPSAPLRALGMVRSLGLGLVGAVQRNAVLRYSLLGVLLAAAVLVPLALRRRAGPGGAEADADAIAAPALTLRPWRWISRALEVLFGPNARDRGYRLPRALVVVLLLVIIGVGSWVRLTRLADLPAGLFCDEAGLGYISYSLAETGRDETGTTLPLYAWSFNVSYKNPIFLYSGIVPIALGGLSDFNVRVTSAVYGIATVIAIFFLARAMLGAWAGLLASAILAVLPWHLHFSRIAFELITYPFFFIVALTLLVRWTQGRRTLPAAMFFFGVTLYTYVPAKLFVPLFLTGFSLLYVPELWRRKGETLLAFVVLLITVAPVAVFDITHQRQSSQYFRNTSIFGSDASADELANRFVENYKAFFSNRFLWDSGDPISRHAVQGHGELYAFLWPLLVIGCAFCLGRRQRVFLLPLWWLVLYPVAASLMTEIPTASRAIIGAPAFALLAALGAAAVLRLPAQIFSSARIALVAQLAIVGLGLWYAVPQARNYWRLYTEVYPRMSAKSYTGFQFGHRDVVHYFLEHQDEYDQFFLTPTENNQPQSFLLFYSAYEPKKLQEGGLGALMRDTKMRVASPEDLGAYGYGKRKLWAVTPPEIALFAEYEEKQRVIAPDGTAAFVIVDVRRPHTWVHQWRVAGPFPSNATPPPPGPDDVARDRAEYAGQPWRLYGNPQAAVRLNDYFHRNADASCAWLTAWVDSDVDREVGVFAGFDDTGEVWLDGNRVTLRKQGNRHESLIDTDVGTGQLHAGRNLVAVKSCDIRDDWRFYFRIGNPDGTEIDALRWNAQP